MQHSYRVARFALVLAACVWWISVPEIVPHAQRGATIMEIQGSGDISPLVNQSVTTTGIVTASFQEKPTAATGFYLQDPQGDGNPATSDGIFVFEGKDHPVLVKPGDRVTVTGVVMEFRGMTEIAVKASPMTVQVVGRGEPVPAPVLLAPPANETDAARYYEAREGMLVGVPDNVPVVGPTTRFNEFVVNIAGDAGRIFQRDVPATTGALLAVGDQGGIVRAANVGDRSGGMVGPLSFAFGVFRVDPVSPYIVTRGADTSSAVGFVLDPNQWTLGSFNVENFFDATLGPGDDKDSTPTPDAYRTKLAKLSAAIAVQLNAPTVLGLMEVENIGVLNDLVAQPLLAPYGYRPILIEGLDPRGIDVALLYRADRVRVTSEPTTFNACVELNDNAYPPATNPFGKQDYCTTSTGKAGNYLFPRPPLVVHLAVSQGRESSAALPVTVVVNHFKAKSGDDPEKQNFTTRRTAEAQAIVRYVDGLIQNGEPNVAVIGDLNDFPNTPPIETLTGGTTAGSSLRDVVTEADLPYTYVFAGQSEILDHILLSRGLAQSFVDIEITHFDADYPDSLAENAAVPNRVSDHDPPVARFRVVSG